MIIHLFLGKDPDNTTSSSVSVSSFSELSLYFLKAFLIFSFFSKHASVVVFAINELVLATGTGVKIELVGISLSNKYKIQLFDEIIVQ